jgi:hypothetical protein
MPCKQRLDICSSHKSRFCSTRNATCPVVKRYPNHASQYHQSISKTIRRQPPKMLDPFYQRDPCVPRDSRPLELIRGAARVFWVGHLSSAHLTWDGGCQILMGHSKTPAQAMQQTYITLTASGMTHKQSVGHIPNGQGVPTLWRRLPHPQYHSFGAPSFFGRCREESKDKKRGHRI